MKRNMMITSIMVLFLGLTLLASPQIADAKKKYYPHKDIDKLQGYWTNSFDKKFYPHIITFNKDGWMVTAYSTVNVCRGGAIKSDKIVFIDKDHFKITSLINEKTYERIDINEEKYKKIYEEYGNCLRFEDSCTEIRLAKDPTNML